MKGRPLKLIMCLAMIVGLTLSLKSSWAASEIHQSQSLDPNEDSYFLIVPETVGIPYRSAHLDPRNPL